ncbi:uncharacterized protein LOC111318912 [Stylophora pistillata]|uniref:uncharacterized protein LOC111318912 n=1 Tax=Stylophora pistillata TaxID=50429 RepID=UPI000C03B363|nr:uncharacterized protein LOC111318912 [Stylophora pistillata]
MSHEVSYRLNPLIMNLFPTTIVLWIAVDAILRGVSAESASNTDRTGYMYRCNESYYRPSNVTDCEGVTGIFYGAVIGSTATAVVGAGILFFVWKLRERNSKNSNGKRERTNRETTEEIGLVDTWLEMTEPSQSHQCMALDERNRSSPLQIQSRRTFYNLPSQ